jgi:hypothetical protein
MESMILNIRRESAIGDDYCCVVGNVQTKAARLQDCVLMLLRSRLQWFDKGNGKGATKM